MLKCSHHVASTMLQKELYADKKAQAMFIKIFSNVMYDDLVEVYGASLVQFLVVELKPGRLQDGKRTLA